MAKLTALRIKNLTERGTHSDGGGLYFQVTPPAGRSWLFRFKRQGRTRWAGLGSYPSIGLSEARTAAESARRLLAQGIDPIEARRTARADTAARTDRTFAAVAEAYRAAHDGAWRNVKHRLQWASTLTSYAFPKLGGMQVSSITTGDVLSVLKPIWQSKPETASRLRGRIEAVLSYAKALKWRTGENAAAWADNLDALLPQTGQIASVRHHAALPWREMGEFMRALRQQKGVGALALRFAILTAARSGSVRAATWQEIDQANALWVIPGAHMKGGRQHRVALSGEALEVLREFQPPAIPERDPGALVFPGERPGRPLSDATLSAVLKRMGRGDLTVHGFRSTFRDWVADATTFPRELAESALAHALKDKVEAAYQRSDLLERRRRLMDEWATFCSRPAPASADIVPLRRA